MKYWRPTDPTPALCWCWVLSTGADLRDRLLRLLGGNRIFPTDDTMDEAGTRIAKYLTMQLW
jgi:hypothetical protein